jgi:CubicO group peptidase (beta-lactamase class C family)
VTSALVGIALSDRRVRSLHQTVGELLGPQLPTTADPGMAKVTVEQLLTMTAGIPADPQGGDALPEMFTSHDWVRFVLGQPLAGRPGTRFAPRQGAGSAGKAWHDRPRLGWRPPLRR